MIMLFPIIGVAIVYVLIPRTYESAASLWALQRYFVIGSTGPESDLLSTPAETQATALTELLQTRDFVDSVVKGIDLAPTLNLGADVVNNPQKLEDSLFNEISKHVVVTPSAYNLFEINYANRNPFVAQQIVRSIITNYGRQSLGLSIAEGQNLLGSYQTQLAGAQNELNAAVNAETQYAHAHANLTQAALSNDPQYALLDAQKTQAQTKVQNIQNTINTIQQSISSQGTQAGTLFQVLDAPQAAFQPVSRTKYYLIGGIAGLVVALLGCIIYLVIVVRRDHGVYAPSDLQSLVEVPILMNLPKVTRATVSLVTTDKMYSQALISESISSRNGHIHRE
jgi:hypothetical protein